VEVIVEHLENMSRILTTKEIKEMQQPLDYKSGYSNDTFDKLYPNTKNPFHGTERDAKNKRNYPIAATFKSSEECDNCHNRAEYSSKINGVLEWKLCKKCYGETNIKKD
jgi:hypothetical protein